MYLSSVTANPRLTGGAVQGIFSYLKGKIRNPLKKQLMRKEISKLNPPIKVKEAFTSERGLVRN